MRRIVGLALLVVAVGVVVLLCRPPRDNLSMARQMAVTSVSDFEYIELLFGQAIDDPSTVTLAALAGALQERHFAIRAAIALHLSQLTPQTAEQFAKLPNEQSEAYLYALSQRDTITAQDRANIEGIRSCWWDAQERMKLDVSGSTGKLINPSSFAVSYCALMNDLSRLTPSLFPGLESDK